MIGLKSSGLVNRHNRALPFTLGDVRFFCALCKIIFPEGIGEWRFVSQN